MNRIKELRERKNLTQQELADNLGISKRTLGYWEKGEVQIKPDKAQALADYFGVPVAYLLGYSEQLPDPEFEKQNNARLIGLFDKIIDNPNTRDELTPEIDKIMKDMAIETGRKEFYRLQNSDGFQKMVDYLTERQIKIVGEVLNSKNGEPETFNPFLNLPKKDGLTRTSNAFSQKKAAAIG